MSTRTSGQTPQRALLPTYPISLYFLENVVFKRQIVRLDFFKDIVFERQIVLRSL